MEFSTLLLIGPVHLVVWVVFFNFIDIFDRTFRKQAVETRTRRRDLFAYVSDAMLRLYMRTGYV